MNIAYMNDPNEGKILQCIFEKTDKSGCWRQYLSKAAGTRKNIEYPYVFMKCFTSLIDDLPMWEMYGDNAKGCCIILDSNTFRGKNEKETVESLYQICYLQINGENLIVAEKDNPMIYVDSIEESLMQIIDIGRRLFQKESELYCKACAEFMSMLNQINFLFKSADYSHEREVRLLYVYQQLDDEFLHTEEKWPKLYVQPDFPVKIQEIITGPKCKETHKFMPYLQEQLTKMCMRKQTDMPQITMSSIQYQ